MANYDSVNSVTASSMSSYDSVNDGSIYSINGVLRPSTVPRLLTFAQGVYSFLDFPLSDSQATNITTLKDNQTTTHDDFHDPRQVIYGKDGSGNPIYAATTQTQHELAYTITPDNVAAKAEWSEVTNPDYHSLCSDDAVDPCRKLYALGWGNDVWVATTNSLGTFDESGVTYTFYDGSTGPGPFLFRSTDGLATMDKISLAHLTNLPSTANGGVGGANNTVITALTTDGEGNWWFGVGKYIFKSTDDGLTWSEEHSLTIGGGNYDDEGCGIKGLVITNSILVCVFGYNDGSVSESRVICAPTSNTSSGWGPTLRLVDLTGAGTQPESYIPVAGDPISLNGEHTARSLQGDGYGMRIAAAAGRVCVCDQNYVAAFDVSESGGSAAAAFVGPVTRLRRSTSSTSSTDLTSIVTDGEGTWYVASKGSTERMGHYPKHLGRIYRSTDNGVTWTLPVGNDTSDDYGKKILALSMGVHLPL